MAWPDSNLFWRNQRVVVTGGAGFLGSFVVEKLQAHGAAEVTVPHIEEYNRYLRWGLMEARLISQCRTVGVVVKQMSRSDREQLPPLVKLRRQRRDGQTGGHGRRMELWR